MVLVAVILISSGMGLLLIAFVQALYLKKNAIRLPEAAGSRALLQENNLSLLHLGESPVAGVGVLKIDQGLTANIVNNLASTLNCNLDWEIVAKNGARVGDLMTEQVQLKEPDLLVLSFGVNDSTKLTSRADWRKGLSACVERFAGEKTQVYLTAVPKLNKFPLLPVPLSWLMGYRAKLLDTEVKYLCNQNDWVYIAGVIEPCSKLMASDGYHPNGKGYQLWADIVSKKITSTFKKL